MLTHLRADHGRFERLFTEIERQCAIVEQGGLPDGKCLDAIVAYLAEHAHRVHSLLEDQIYAVLAASLPRFGRDLYDVAKDHRQSLRAFRAFAQSAQKVDERFVDRARSYIANERGHFIAEEEILFPYAQKLLATEHWREIERLSAKRPISQSPRIARLLARDA